MKSRIIRILRRVAAWLRGHRGEIIYYSCVLGALTIIAVGAEAYRRDKTAPEPAALPVAEITRPESEEPVYRLPENMRLIRPYSAQPQWNEQDLSWQAHPAADYASEDGFIRALTDGTIMELGKSAVLGGFVLIESGEVQMKYCGITPEEKLEAGDEIRMGDLIGAAANTMPGELHLGSHLHLEAYRQGEGIDPQSLLSSAD